MTKYTITSKPGMAPFSTADSIASAIADSVRARRNGLDGQIIGDDLDATPGDCDEAARQLGWERDPSAADMDMPVNANIVARDMA